MRLTKKLEAEILKLYNAYWQAYLNGNMKVLASTLDEDSYIVGSSENEVFKNKKAAVKFYKATVGQAAWKAEFRNMKINMMPVKNSVMINEQSDFYVLIGNTWTFYGHRRISTQFRKKNSKWKIIQQHGSLPDPKGGEPINADKLKAENIRLRDVVRRSTMEVDDKNRELEIEAALERLRARTMAMQKSDELTETYFLLFQQFTELGETSEQISIGIFNEDENIMELYSTIYGSQWKEAAKVDLDEPVVMKKIYTAWKEQKKSLVIDLAGTDLRKYNTYRKKLSNLDYKEERWVIHIAFFSKGVLTFSTTKPHPPETIRLLERFAGVFDGTYTRFLDLKNAEAQAREAQIEVALERVRARTMAMHQSGELAETASVLFKQIKDLGFEMWSCGFCIWKPNDIVEGWFGADAGGLLRPLAIPYKEEPTHRDIYEASLRGNTVYKTVWEGKSLEEHYAFLHTIPSVKVAIQQLEQAGLSLPSKQCYYVGFFKHGYLLLITTEPKDEALDLTKRFAAVFDLTYTRFLDLQKAEAQAREAKIEVALERTRTQSMIMQHSKELDDTLRVFHEQVLLLGINSEFSFLWLPDEDKDRHIFWAAWAENFPTGQLTKNNSTVFRSKAINYPLDRNEPATAQCLVDWKSNQPVISYHVPPDAVENYFGAWQELIDGVENLKPQHFRDGLYYVEAFMKYGCFGVMVKNELPEDEKKILGRFAIEFERAYTRFLDLQKAEEQAREAQIEAALERVRAKAMAMHSSQDLAETIKAFYHQMGLLNLMPRRCGVGLIDKETREADLTGMIISDQGEPKEVAGKLKLAGHPLLENVYDHWLLQKEYHDALRGNQINEYYRLVGSQLSIQSYPHDAVQFGYFFFFREGAVYAWTDKEFAEDELKIYRRFTSVLSLTYKRYMDLKLAEAQAREAKIEAALERVRAKAMAMHKSDDLSPAVAIVFEELDKLDLGMSRCGIGILNKEKRNGDVYTTTVSDHGAIVQLAGDESMDIHPLLQGAFDAWLKQEDFSYTLQGEDLVQYYKAVGATNIRLPQSQTEGQKQYYYFTPLHSGGLFAFRDAEFPEEGRAVMKRFANVFNLTYKRFLDLQKAEAQAREAQIEAALERVRTRTMAIQRSEELDAVIKSIYSELKHLDVSFARCFIMIFDEQKGATWWMGSPDDDLFHEGFYVPYHTHPPHLAYLKGWEERQQKWEYWLRGQIKKDWDEFVFNKTELSKLPPVVIQDMKSFEFAHLAASFENFGCITTGGLERLSEEPFSILSRFAKVFDQTYTRFNDLKKAEAQAREARIEAALERVRSKAMSMQKSEDLGDAIAIVFEELDKLDMGTLRCGISIINKEKRTTNIWSTTKVGKDSAIQVTGDESMDIHPLLRGAYNAWLKLEEYSYVLEGEDLNRFYTALSGTNFKLPGSESGEIKEDERQYLYVAHFPAGGLYAFRETEFSEEAKTVIGRFADVFNLTYTRFNDLQQAEANAREAVKQAALDRVRAEIASMRTTNDLERITPLIWNELTILGIPFIRCGVFIMDDSQKLIHTFLSTPDGKAIAAFHLPYDTPGNITRVLSHWQNKKIYTDYWNESVFTEFVDTLVKQGALASPEHYLETLPHGGFYLHFLPFLQGMLYVGNTTALAAEEIKLIQSVADAFSTAYARYEDFNKLEAAKQQVEKTLVDLKQTQTQLVQSEKMASLGQLTAGIAHEIQNPLNFVNNFSEVSNELIEEMNAEIEKGDMEEAKAIANDIKQNLEKITHHGKRADAIVKGMLQHSRTSGSVKEPTDINVLADEYLRLCYHGLRAKDKSFNATFETDFDETIGKVNIIPQDMGRVILNLLTNAFYAVAEKAKQNGAAYEPTVTVSTKRVDSPLGDGGRRAEIKVKDNGNGIPQKILDKIFQPFFTTKPAGQGTGLGLSLAYDIVKAHGGEIKVETAEREGTEFVIIL